MGQKEFDIPSEVERLRADYETVIGSPFAHFYCPILLEDSRAELCMGHLVNKVIPNSNRKQIVQRKDVDGFYGSLVEKSFSTLIRGKKAGVWHAFFDKALSSDLRPTFEVNGRAVDHYVVKKNRSSIDPVVKMENASGEFINVAFKVSNELQLDQSRVQLVVDRDYLPEATAALLKAAHLTMFSLLGYRYVFHPAGYTLAKILQRFYLDARKLSRKKQRDAAAKYFPPHSGMILPLVKYNSDLIKGTVDDRRVLACCGSSGHPYAMGALIRTGDDMHIVFLPPDRPESADTYDQFVRNEKGSLLVKVFEYQPSQPGQPAKWITNPGPPIRMDPAPSECETI